MRRQGHDGSLTRCPIWTFQPRPGFRAGLFCGLAKLETERATLRQMLEGDRLSQLGIILASLLKQ
jgi:hypothetical protein